MLREEHIEELVSHLEKDGYWRIKLGERSLENTSPESETKEALMERGNVHDLIVFHPVCHSGLLQKLLEFIAEDLSEPYNVYTLRYFIELYPQLCILVMDVPSCAVGAKTKTLLTSNNKLEENSAEGWMNEIFTHGTLIAVSISQLQDPRQCVSSDEQLTCDVVGYIGMIVVKKQYRKQGLGSFLIRTTLYLMKLSNVQQVFLETEIKNTDALQFYETLGFYRIQLKTCYYLCGQDAFLLKKNICAASQAPHTNVALSQSFSFGNI